MRNPTNEDLKRKALENMFEKPFYVFLRNNKFRIISVLRIIRARKPRKELEKEDALWIKYYSNLELPLLADEKIKQLIEKRKKIYSSYLELEPKKRIDLQLEFSSLMLTYLKEEAFKNNLVASTCNLFRDFSLNIKQPPKIRKEAGEVLDYLLEPLVSIVEDWAKVKPEEIYARVSQMPVLMRKLIAETIKSIADDRQNIVESEKITPISYKRIFEKAGLKPKDEVILVSSFCIANAVIGKVFGVTDEAIRTKVQRLWKIPKVIEAYREKTAFITSPFTEKACEKDREGKQKKTYNLEKY